MAWTMRGWAALGTLLLMAMACPPADEGTRPATSEAKAKGGMTMVLIETSKGTIKVELDGDKAPITVENLPAYTDDGVFDGTICHRGIDGCMIQG